LSLSRGADLANLKEDDAATASRARAETDSAAATHTYARAIAGAASDESDSARGAACGIGAPALTIDGTTRRLRDTLPEMVSRLKRDPAKWYRKNKLEAPDSLPTSSPTR